MTNQRLKKWIFISR